LPIVLSDIEIFRELFPAAIFASPYDPTPWIKVLNDLPQLKPGEQGEIFRTHSWSEVRDLFWRTVQRLGNSSNEN
jgi:hypothetical protein